MGYVYRFKDLADGIYKYVGEVYGKRGLRQRIYEHLKYDEWCKNSTYLIEYLVVDSRTDAEAYEAHYIAFHKTYNYYNIDKSDWGLSTSLKNRDDEWRESQYHSLSDFKVNKKHKIRTPDIREVISVLCNYEDRPLYSEDRDKLHEELEKIGLYIRYVGVKTLNDVVDEICGQSYLYRFQNKDSNTGMAYLNKRRKNDDGSENTYRNRRYWMLSKCS